MLLLLYASIIYTPPSSHLLTAPSLPHFLPFLLFFSSFFPAAARPAVVARGYATEESEADFDARWIVSQRRHPPATVLVLLFIYARITSTHSHTAVAWF